MVIARDHVLCAEIQEGDDLHPCHFLNIALVAQPDAVGEGRFGPQKG